MAASANVYDRAAGLRETLQTSDSLAREAVNVLETYGTHLETLMESVERVAARAQVTSTATHSRRGDPGVLCCTRNLWRYCRLY